MKTTKMDEELIPCPFCGSPGFAGKHLHSPKMFVARCSSEGMSCIFPSTGPMNTLDEAIKRWNTRKSLVIDKNYMYYLIHYSYGSVSIIEYNDAQSLAKAVVEKHHGDIKYLDQLYATDPRFWENDALIIKGEIITPE